MEITHTELAFKWLHSGSLIAVLMPFRVLEDIRFWNLWEQNTIGTQILRVPDRFPYHQHLVVARANFNRSPYGYSNFATDATRRLNKVRAGEDIVMLDKPGLELDFRRCYAWDEGKPVVIRNTMPRAEQALEALSQMPEVNATQEWCDLMRVQEIDNSFQPAMQAEATHVIQLAAAGMLSGAKFIIDGREVLLSTEEVRYWVEEKTQEIGDDGKAEDVEVRVQRIAYRINMFWLDTGEYQVIDSRNEDEYYAFLEGNLLDILNAVNATFKPRYNGDYTFLLPYFQRLHSPRDIGEEDGLFTTQKHDVAAHYLTLNRYPAAIYAGATGVGKTISSISLMAIRSGILDGKPGKIVFLSPEDSANKTANEARAILQEVPNLQVAVVGEETVKVLRYEQDNGVAMFKGVRTQPDRKTKRHVLEEVRALMESPYPAFIVVPYQVAKMGSPWENVQAKKTSWIFQERHVDAIDADGYTYSKQERFKVKQEVLVCPKCGQKLHNDYVNHGIMVDEAGFKKEKLKCEAVDPVTGKECGAPLWQTIPFAYGGRWPVAEYLNQKYGKRYWLIADEIHNSRAEDSDLGGATMDIASSAREIIILSATLYNGYAKSLFFTLYRFNPKFREKFQFNESLIYALQHGLIKEVVRYERSRSGHGYSGYAREKQVRISAAPGATAQQVRELITCSVFRELYQIGIDLPPKHESVVPIPPSEEMKPGLRVLDTFKRAALVVYREDKSPIAQWRQAALGWVDCPENEAVWNYALPGVPDGHLTPKEAVLMNLIQEAVDDNDDGICIFFDQVNRRSPIPRIQKLLAEEKRYVIVLEADTARRIERQDYVIEQGKKSRAHGHAPILLTGNRLLKEGVDLLDYRWVVDYSPDFDIIILLQRMGRFHRLGTRGPVNYFFPFYSGTLQEDAVALITNKLVAANQIAGRVGGGLAQFASATGIVNQLIGQAMEKDGKRLTMLMQQRVVSDVYTPRGVMPISLPVVEVTHKGNGNGHKGNGKLVEATLRPMQPVEMITSEAFVELVGRAQEMLVAGKKRADVIRELTPRLF